MVSSLVVGRVGRLLRMEMGFRPSSGIASWSIFAASLGPKGLVESN